MVPRHSFAGTEVALPQTAEDDADAQLNWPSYGQAAVGAAGYGILATHNATAPLATASIAKVVTAVCVLAKHPLSSSEAGPTITLSQEDVDLYNSYVSQDGSVMSVRVGQQLTERQALESMLLKSANNMADSLAIWAFGSLNSYSRYANQYAQQLGMTATTIGSDASGFNPDTVSTAGDLVKLGEAAMQNPALAQIVGERLATIPAVGIIYNTNALLGQNGIVGIKTGNSDQDTGAFLYAASYQQAGQTITVYGAIMGAPSLARAQDDAITLLQSTEAGFSPHSLVTAGQPIGRYRLPWGKTYQVVAENDITLLGWQSRAPITHISLARLNVPAKNGTEVGTLSARASSGTSYGSSLILQRSVAKPSIWWRLTHPLQ
jgi:D-alanyl-D-alanine carboxypeptidase (penicillin-binding protein 5/6)